MATTKPRITISLRPNTHATLKRMSELTGQPMATIVSELIEEVHPPLMRTIALLEAAKDAPEKVRSGLRLIAEDIEDSMRSTLSDHEQQTDFLLHALSDSKSSSASARDTRGQTLKKKSAPKKSNPPPTNRGVRSKSGAKKGKKDA